MHTIRLERLNETVQRNEVFGSRNFSLYHSRGTRRTNQDGLMVAEFAPDRVLAMVADGHGTMGERLVSAFFDEVQSVFLSEPVSLCDGLKEAAIRAAGREEIRDVEVDTSCGGGSTPGAVVAGFYLDGDNIRFFHAGDASAVLLDLNENLTDEHRIVFRTKPHLQIDEVTGEEMKDVPARRIDRENISNLEFEESPVFTIHPESRILVHSDGFKYASPGELIRSTCQQRDVAAMLKKLGSRFEANQKSGMGFDNLSIIAF